MIKRSESGLDVTHKRAVAILHEFLEAYQSLGDPRAYAYANVINELRKHASLDEFLSIDRPGVGPKMRKKLALIASHKPIPKLTRLRKQVAVLAQLQTILGVGVETSREWVRAGAYDVASAKKLVKSGKINPTNMQLIGLKYYNDLHTRIPRAEVAEIAAYVCARMHIKVCAYLLVGSYRRGMKTSGDVDIIVRGKADSAPPRGTILLTSGPDRASFLIKWQRWRQVDILYCTDAEYPFALLYFTGSYEFNIAMRARAQKMGWSLNQKEMTGWPGHAASEQDIFAALGLKYVEPSARIDGSSLSSVDA